MAVSDKFWHRAAAATLAVGFLLAFVRPLRGGASGPVKEIPQTYSIVLESRLPKDLERVQQATIHLPELPLSAKLDLQQGLFRCSIHSLKAPQSYLVTLYLPDGQQAIARGVLIQRGEDWVAQVGDWSRLARGGSQLASQAAKRPVSVQWQRPELVTPRATWIGRLQVNRVLPPQHYPQQVGGHHHR